jgi:hypothetical protein
MWEYSDNFFAAVGSEHEIFVVRYKDACDPWEAGNRAQILVIAGVDHVDRIVSSVGYVECSGSVVDGGVVEAALLLMWW